VGQEGDQFHANRLITSSSSVTINALFPSKIVFVFMNMFNRTTSKSHGTESMEIVSSSREPESAQHAPALANNHLPAAFSRSELLNQKRRWRNKSPFLFLSVSMD